MIISFYHISGMADMNPNTLGKKPIRSLPSREQGDRTRKAKILSEPFSSYCNNCEELQDYLDRRILDFHKLLPKRFVTYLSSHKFPHTIKDLLDLDAKKLMKAKGIGVSTVNQITRFLNNIAELEVQYGITCPNFVIGPDIQSSFEDPEELFSGLDKLKIRWFEEHLPSRFVTFLNSHPELVTIKNLLNLNTIRLLEEKQIGEATLKEVLNFLNALPDLNLKVKDDSDCRMRLESHGSGETIMTILDDEPSHFHNILEIYYSIIHHFLDLRSERDNLIFQRRFGMGKTIQEIASEFHLSNERVHRIVNRCIEMLTRPLSPFEMRFKSYIVRMLHEMSSFIDERLCPESSCDTWFINILSYIYPALPSRANRLTIQEIWRSKHLSNIYGRLKKQEIGLHQFTFENIYQSMGIKDPDDIMDLYRILLCGHWAGIDVKDGVAYVVRTGSSGGFLGIVR
jgi:RNA polymerase sigma factor (sigma-70 family)